MSAVHLAQVVNQGAGTFHHAISAASTNLTVVKASPGAINSLVLSNTDAVNVFFFKLYNKATTPVLATDTPILVVRIPAGSTHAIPTGPFGLRLSDGIAYAITASIANNDATGIAANGAVVAMSYT